MATFCLYVEGEKDADRLWSLGIPATTHQGGAEAFSGHAAEYMEQLSFAGVHKLWLLPDNDLPGRSLMREVGRAALRAGLEIRWLEIPGLPPKGDVSDYLDAGHTKDELLSLLRACPALTAPPEEPKPEPAPSDQPPNDGEEAGDGRPVNGRFVVKEGRFCRLRSTTHGPVEEPLCNFAARIVEEITVDDGLTQSKRYVVSGRLAGSGLTLPTVQVPATEFATLKWVSDQWGIRALVAPGHGLREALAYAIQAYSQGAPARRVYTHTGWRETERGWVYLTAAGAVGHPGVFDVELGKYARYNLPFEPEEPRRAMQTSLKLLEIAPLPVTVPLLGSVYRAVLSQFLPPDYTVWLEGQTGAYKSTLAGLFLSHWGPFHRLSLPETFTSTVNALEVAAFCLKDALLVIDDYAPAGHDPRDLSGKVAQLIRSLGNRSARGRLGGDLRARPSFFPRGLVCVTGENHPGIHSLVARLLVVEIRADQVRLDRLTAAQAEAWRLPHALAGYVAWLAPQVGQGLSRQLDEEFGALRQRAYDAGGRGRIPEALANAYLGFQWALAYAEEVEALSPEEAQAWADLGWEAILAAGASQRATVEADRPSARFFGVLQELLDTGQALLLPRESTAGYSGKAALLGAVDGKAVALLYPEVAYKTVSEFCQRSGEPFRVPPSRFWKDLLGEGLVLPDSEGKATKTARIFGEARRMLHVSLSALKEKFGMDFSARERPDEHPEKNAQGEAWWQ